MAWNFFGISLPCYGKTPNLTSMAWKKREFGFHGVEVGEVWWFGSLVVWWKRGRNDEATKTMGKTTTPRAGGAKNEGGREIWG
jgi:hypothetical protein